MMHTLVIGSKKFVCVNALTKMTGEPIGSDRMDFECGLQSVLFHR